MALDFADRLESEFNITTSPVTGKEFRSVCRRWLQLFCPHVKRNTGRWVYKNFWWHAYSFHHEAAIAGSRAVEAYESMPVEPFFLFHETRDKLFDCSSAAWPDLRVLDADIYVFPRSLAWTFVTTHEMSLGLGPYFALPPPGSSQTPSDVAQNV